MRLWLVCLESADLFSWSHHHGGVEVGGCYMTLAKGQFLGMSRYRIQTACTESLLDQKVSMHSWSGSSKALAIQYGSCLPQSPVDVLSWEGPYFLNLISVSFILCLTHHCSLFQPCNRLRHITSLFALSIWVFYLALKRNLTQPRITWEKTFFIKLVFGHVC